MKKFKIFLISVALASFSVPSASALIALYGYKGSATTIGGNGRLGSVASGVLAIDLDTYEATYIGLIRIGTGRNRVFYFQETPLQNFVTTQIYGPSGATYTVLAKAEAPGTQFAGVVSQQARAVGRNSTLLIKTLDGGAYWILPRTLTSSGLVISEDATFDYLGTETGKYTLNVKMTRLANDAGFSVAQAIAPMRAYYEQAGFQELILPPAN
jgi:hypothetical protein